MINVGKAFPNKCNSVVTQTGQQGLNSLESEFHRYLDTIQSKLLGISYNIYIKSGRIEGTDLAFLILRLETLGNEHE